MTHTHAERGRLRQTLKLNGSECLMQRWRGGWRKGRGRMKRKKEEVWGGAIETEGGRAAHSEAYLSTWRCDVHVWRLWHIVRQRGGSHARLLAEKMSELSQRAGCLHSTVQPTAHTHMHAYSCRICCYATRLLMDFWFDLWYGEREKDCWLEETRKGGNELEGRGDRWNGGWKGGVKYVRAEEEVCGVWNTGEGNERELKGRQRKRQTNNLQISLLSFSPHFALFLQTAGCINTYSKFGISLEDLARGHSMLNAFILCVCVCASTRALKYAGNADISSCQNRQYSSFHASLGIQ